VVLSEVLGAGSVFADQTLDFLACVIATSANAGKLRKNILPEQQSLVFTEYSRAPNFLASSLGVVSSLLSVGLNLRLNLAKLHNGACASAWH
jgi:hypothetical protein